MAKYFIWLPYMCVFGVKSDRLLGGKTTVAADVTRKGVEYNALIDFLPGLVTALILGSILIVAAKYLPDAIRKKIGE